MTTPPQPANAELIELANRLDALAAECDEAKYDELRPDCTNEMRQAAAALRAAAEREARLREALQIQQDESDLQQQGYKLCDNPDHPIFVKWLGPSKPGESGYDRHFQMSALRRAMRIAALAARTPGGTQRKGGG